MIRMMLLSSVFLATVHTFSQAEEIAAPNIYLEGRFSIQAVTYVPAVREYHRITFRIKTEHGRFFYFNIAKFKEELKGFVVGDTYDLKIKVTDIFTLETDKQKKIYDHPNNLTGYLVNGKLESVDKVTDNKAMNADK